MVLFWYCTPKSPKPIQLGDSSLSHFQVHVVQTCTNPNLGSSLYDPHHGGPTSIGSQQSAGRGQSRSFAAFIGASCHGVARGKLGWNGWDLDGHLNSQANVYNNIQQYTIIYIYIYYIYNNIQYLYNNIQ